MIWDFDRDKYEGYHRLNAKKIDEKQHNYYFISTIPTIQFFLMKNSMILYSKTGNKIYILMFIFAIQKGFYHETFSDFNPAHPGRYSTTI